MKLFQYTMIFLGAMIFLHDTYAQTTDYWHNAKSLLAEFVQEYDLCRDQTNALFINSNKNYIEKCFFVIKNYGGSLSFYIDTHPFTFKKFIIPLGHDQHEKLCKACDFFLDIVPKCVAEEEESDLCCLLLPFPLSLSASASLIQKREEKFKKPFSDFKKLLQAVMQESIIK